MSMFGTAKEKRTQLYFRDDGAAIFRKLEVENTFLVEKNVKGEIIKAWMLKYKLLKRFDGFPGIMGAGDTITMAYGRDIILDPFKQLTAKEAPKKGSDLKKDFISNIASAVFYKHSQKANGSQVMSAVIIWLGVIMVMLALAIGARVGLK